MPRPVGFKVRVPVDGSAGPAMVTLDCAPEPVDMDALHHDELLAWARRWRAQRDFLCWVVRAGWADATNRRVAGGWKSARAREAANARRDARIVAARAAGVPVAQLAERFGLTRQRVNAILRNAK